ncbi:sulfatase-like hydrolase/transferase [Streptomyces sp. ALI-76-A]|uniref:sulfatase-like hydrolase/transferase n=1 Tax=Streptomyces sp. ALI-76-A TaxID=3025736 RepID=UPI00256EA42E|nr:sulfatase-like hydrolase/transferase [Streptomyces sp. ALI-76-A]MDL5201468.1 sulfatase-like hydrolase/transferase [Streptomyces sp. ALI-76-A]
MPVFTRFRRPPDTADDPASGIAVSAVEPGETAPGEAASAAGASPTEGSPAGASRGARLRARLAHWRSWRARHPTAARVLYWTTTALAAVLVLGALLLPNRIVALQPNRFTRLPVEAIIGAAVLLALPRRPRVVLAAFSGAVLGALTILNVLDMGFIEYLGRGFNLVLDWGLLDDAQAYVEDSMGRTTAVGATVGAVVLVVLLLVVMALATVRLSELLVRDTRVATRSILVAGVVWITCSSLGLQNNGMPIASERAAGALKLQARRVTDTVRDEAAFAKEAKADRFGATPAGRLLPDLRGKDVIFTFIESYGRSALEDPVIAPGVVRTLDTGTAALEKAGFHARSGWLTSATYGGSSWLGHSTTMSGLWIDNQQRYRTVMAGDHLSLTKAFQKTGAWDTVGVMPGVQKGWPEQRFYGLDKVYNAFQLGYRGPKFSWSTMPDQYALEAFQRLVHGKKRDRPLMSEIILTSSHQPWAPIPELVDWDRLGDGSVFGPIQQAGVDPSDVLTDSTRSKEEYGRSVQYSVTSLIQWLERYGTDDTVLVFLGDHQPIARVSGRGASRDVPVTVVAKDPEVLEKIASWNWTEGLKPASDAPVWKMSAFRDRFLTAYGSTPRPATD